MQFNLINNKEMLVSCAFRPTTIAVAYNRQQFIAMCTGSCRPCGLTVAGILSYVGKVSFGLCLAVFDFFLPVVSTTNNVSLDEQLEFPAG